MKDLDHIAPEPGLRPPETVMRLSRMGAMFPSRLSFLRALTRRLHHEGARLTRPVWEIDAQGYGHAVYTIAVGGRPYSLVAVSSHLPDDLRSDRVIATAWDTAYVLFDGVPGAADIARLVAEAPKQEAARFSERDLVLSRANRSVRLFSHVVERLRAGQQPDPALIDSVGYLMRTTAVYGNGKFGIADRALYADRPGLSGPFAAEMLTVWMIRTFTHELVEHLGGAPLDRDIKRHLGIGNATGLGMAPFLVSHPVLLHNWMTARETALARVRRLPALDDAARGTLHALAERAQRHLDSWTLPDPHHAAILARLRQDWAELRVWMRDGFLQDAPLDALIRRAERYDAPTQELAVSLAIEPFGRLVDDLCDGMNDNSGLAPLPFATPQEARRAIERHFDWALALRFDDPDETRQFWYVSEEKLEPRLGDRHSEDGAERESPLDIARRVQELYHALDESCDLRAFRAASPEHELALTRLACVMRHPYSEIRDNLIGAGCLPIDMLRSKLSFFGATKFDPKSDRWTRVTLAQGAPLPDELHSPRADDWWMAVRA
ncbi:hypothetical protein [Cognatishimia sp. F0-27]|uniref:hypothetical protein n=1 Tax=Cognatishimia sp. F0-27 TaxID=2816855 RepID=UPI001D0C7153|nr:hypothetical protein [Cognatishimia sp. F0-27]MCC1491952.1 hypothetical protein [Cognatishimia sp. F0-27]